MPSFENCEIKEITDWLNCEMKDAGIHLLNDKEIITWVPYSRKANDEEDGDSKGENDFEVKISKNDVFQCFSMDLVWLE